MGCFFACFRMREKKRKNVHLAAGASPPRFREHVAAKNRALAARLKNPVVETQAPSPQFFEGISDLRKPETLHRRSGVNLRWTQQLVTPVEVPVVQRPNEYAKVVEDTRKGLISSEQKNPIQEMGELASELAELSRTIDKEVEDFERLGNEVKYLRSRGTFKRSPISKTQMVTVTEQSLQHSDSGVKRVVSSKQSFSVSTEKSVISDAQYSIEEITKPALMPNKVSAKEDVTSKPQQNIADSNKLSARDASRTRSVGKTVRFDLASETPSASFDPANTGNEENSYDSTLDSSISQSSYAVEEGDDEEGVISEESQSYSCSYTGSESIISDVSRSGESADLYSEDNSVSKSTSSSRVTENEDEAEEVGSNASKINTPALKRPSRYQNYESSSDEEEFDSLSDTEDSFESIDSEARDETQNVQQFEVPAQVNQSPLLQKSSSPLNLVDDEQPTWTGCSKGFENASVNNNARIRAQYVCPVLNPVENLSQWKALKKDSKIDAFGNTKEFYETSEAWVESFEMRENQTKGNMYPKLSPTKKQKVEERSMETVRKCLHDSSIQMSGSETKENIHPVVCLDYKKNENIIEVKEESNQRRKLIPLSVEPVFKGPKALFSQHITNSKAVPGDVWRPDAFYVDTSLSQWLKPTEATENGDRNAYSLRDCKEDLPKAGQIPTRQDILESEVNKRWNNLQSQNQQATTVLASRSASALKVDCRPTIGASGLQNPNDAAEKWTSPSRSPSTNNDERPILGALSIEHIKAAAANQISPRRSPTSKELDDRPILGVVAAHWNDKTKSPSKREDRKGGIPNTTNKYKEDQKVSWDSTPFEDKLERALSNRREYERHARNISS